MVKTSLVVAHLIKMSFNYRSYEHRYRTHKKEAPWEF